VSSLSRPKIPKVSPCARSPFYTKARRSPTMSVQGRVMQVHSDPLPLQWPPLLPSISPQLSLAFSHSPVNIQLFFFSLFCTITWARSVHKSRSLYMILRLTHDENVLRDKDFTQGLEPCRPHRFRGQVVPFFLTRVFQC